MKHTLLSLSIVAALTACGGSDGDAPKTIGFTPNTDTVPEVFVTNEAGDKVELEAFTAVVTKLADEDGINATGKVEIVDATPGESSFYPLDTTQSAVTDYTPKVTSAYGEFTFSATGEWSYTLWRGREDSDTPEHPSVTALVAAGMDDLEETFTITTADGTQKVFTLVIRGIDEPATFSGDISSKKVDRDTGGNTSGTITVADANPAEAEFAPLAQQPLEAVDAENPDYGKPKYGAATFDPVLGKWTYDLDETHADVIALDSSEKSLNDTFLIKSLDGTEQEITVLIKGTDPVAADINGVPGGIDEEPAEGEEPVVNAVATYDPAVELFASGTVTVVDPNFEEDEFTAVTDITSTNGFGTYSVTDAGKWTYVVDKSHASVAALTSGSAPLEDTFTLTAKDGTTAEAMINIMPPQPSLKVAQMTHTGGKARFRLDFSSAVKAGSAVFRTKFENLVETAEYTLIMTKPWDVGYGMLGVLFNADGTMALRTATRTAGTTGGSAKDLLPLSNTFVQGQWLTVEMSWDPTNAIADTADDNLDGTPAQVSLRINGEAVRSADGTTITADVFDSLARHIQSTKTGVNMFQFQCAADAADPAGSCFVDDIRVYDDTGALKVYENFETPENFASGNNLTKGGKFGSNTVENAVAADDI